MKLFGMIAYAGSGLLFLAFVANLVLARGGAALLGTVAEALTLFLAAALFGVGTLADEARSES